MNARVRIELVNPRWIKGDADDPDDQCAHGGIEIEIDGAPLFPPYDGPLNATSAGLYLLRSIDDDHMPGLSVSSDDDIPILPISGHAWSGGPNGPYHVTNICGPGGVDFVVEHVDSDVLIGDQKLRVSFVDWSAAVLAFVESIEAFYAASSPKNPDRGDPEGWHWFWFEWRERKARATQQV